MLNEIILETFGTIPKTMIILGSGIGEFKEALKDVTSIPYHELFDFKTDASIGHLGMMHLGRLVGHEIIVLEGRLHYYEGSSDSKMRELIQSFAAIGVKNLIVTNACGGMNESFTPGDIMVIRDHINMMGRNPLVGTNNNSLGERFVDMSEPYDLKFRTLIQEVAKTEKISLQEGVYVSYLGPSYETKAEIRMFRMLGGDAIGMSTVPEVIVARHASMRVLGLSVITNMATGISKNKLSHQEVLETSQKAVGTLTRLLTGFITRLS